MHCPHVPKTSKSLRTVQHRLYIRINFFSEIFHIMCGVKSQCIAYSFWVFSPFFIISNLFLHGHYLSCLAFMTRSHHTCLHFADPMINTLHSFNFFSFANLLFGSAPPRESFGAAPLAHRAPPQSYCPSLSYLLSLTL